MAFRPGVHQRRSIRLKGYDYTRPGAYFVTIVTQNRERLFGDIIARRMRLSPFGIIARDEWLNTAIRRPGIVLDAFVVMPDHFHGIVIIRRGVERVGHDGGMTTGRSRGAARRAPTVADIDIGPARRARIDVADIGIRAARRAPVGTADTDVHTARRAPSETIEQFGCPVPGSIPTIVRSFKSAVTKRINECRGTPGHPVWQRNYYERIIRDEFALMCIRRYIIANPARG